MKIKKIKKLAEYIHKETTTIAKDDNPYEFTFGVQVMGNIIIEEMEEIWGVDLDEYKVDLVSKPKEVKTETKTEVFKLPSYCGVPVFDIVTEILSNCLKINQEEIIPDSKLADDLGVDSLDIIQIIMSIEEEFDFEFSENEVNDMHTNISVRELVELIKYKLQ